MVFKSPQMISLCLLAWLHEESERSLRDQVLNLRESTGLHQYIETLRPLLSREALYREGLQEFAAQPSRRARVHLQTSQEASSGHAQRCPDVEQLTLPDAVWVCSSFVIFWFHMLCLFYSALQVHLAGCVVARVTLEL